MNKQNQNKTNVTINNTYEGNVSRISNIPNVLSFWATYVGVSAMYAIVCTIAVVFIAVSTKYSDSIGYYMMMVLRFVILPILSIAMLITIVETLMYACRNLKTLKYSVSIPIQEFEFSRLGIPTLGKYFNYMLLNLFTYKFSKNGIVRVECAYAELENIKKSIRAAIVYYSSIDKCIITKEDLIFLCDSSKELFLDSIPELTEFRFAVTLVNYSDKFSQKEKDKFKLWIAKDGSIHAAYKDEEGKSYDTNLSMFYGDVVASVGSGSYGEVRYGYQDKSVFRSKTCKYIKNRSKQDITFGFISIPVLLVLVLIMVGGF